MIDVEVAINGFKKHNEDEYISYCADMFGYTGKDIPIVGDAQATVTPPYFHSSPCESPPFNYLTTLTLPGPVSEIDCINRCQFLSSKHGLYIRISNPESENYSLIDIYLGMYVYVDDTDAGLVLLGS